MSLCVELFLLEKMLKILWMSILLLSMSNSFDFNYYFRQMNFPNFCKDKEFKQFISLMLCKNPINRLFKLSQIKNNIWFKDFNWENLISLNSEPAFIPQLPKDEIKKSNVPFVTFLQVKVF